MASRAPASVSPTPAEAVAAPTPSRHRESPRVRTALKISSPGDSAEREAEATAKRVAVMPAIGLGPIARQTPLMAARAPVIPVPRPQAPAGSAAPPATARPPEETSPELTAAIKKELGGGQPLPPDVASFMAPRFKANFGAVRIHTDARAANLATRLGARAFTLGRDIFFNTGQFQPDTKEGTELIAHELTHTVQQREVVQREVAQAAPVEVRETSAPKVQRGIISKALDWIADKANYIPGFRLFTVVIGVNPINMSTVERSGANVIRGLIELIPGGGLIVDALEGYGIFEKVGKWAEEQFRTLGMVGSAFRDALMEFLDSLGWSDIFHPVAVVERAIEIFTRPVKKLIDFGKGLVAGILRFIREAILKPLAALAEGTRGYPLLKAVLGEDPVTGEKVPQTADTLIGGFMTLIGQQEIWENIKKSNAIPRAWAWFKNALKTLFALVSSIPTRFMDTLKSLEIMDLVLPWRAFIKVGKAFASFIGDFLSWALGTVLSLLEIILDVVAPKAVPYVKKAGASFQKILKDPITFVKTLVAAGMLGFNQFRSKFLTHLKNAMVQWLTGAMAGANLYIPKNLNVLEILKFALSVLGLTWANIRTKLVAATNETVVKALETGFDVVNKLVTEGPAAAWEEIVKSLTNLQDMVVEEIKSYVKGKIVEIAVTKLLSMLSPAGAFIQAIIAIWNTIMFFIERIKQIAAVAKSFVDSIITIAAGTIKPAADKVETTMAGMLVLVISFLARFAGLGKVSDAVKKLIDKVRAPIDKGLDRVVAWIVEKARALGRFVAQAGVPHDPQQRLQLAVRAAQPAVRGLAARGPLSAGLLQRVLDFVRVRYGLTSIEPFQDRNGWQVRLRINPEVVMPIEAVEQALGSGALNIERLIAAAADAMMTDPRVVRERERIVRAHGGPAGLAAAGQRGADTVIPTIQVGPGPGFLGAAGALRDINRPDQFAPPYATNLPPHEFITMPFRPAVVGEMQSVPGPGGVVVGRGMEGGKRASVSYPALVRRYRAIANVQTPPLSDREMGSIIANYIRSGAMPAPFDQGPNAMFLAEIGRVVGSVEVARSQSFALELEMILHLLQTGTLTFEEAFARGSAVNPMTMVGAPAAARARRAEIQDGTRRPGGEAGKAVDAFAARRRQLIITYAMQVIRSRGLTFSTPAALNRWAQDELVAIIRGRAEELFGLRGLSN